MFLTILLRFFLLLNLFVCCNIIKTKLKERFKFLLARVSIRIDKFVTRQIMSFESLTVYSQF